MRLSAIALAISRLGRNLGGLGYPTFALDLASTIGLGPLLTPGVTYTASGARALVQQYDGSFVQPLANEVPLAGGRRVQNFARSADISSLSHWLRIAGGTGTAPVPVVSAEAPPSGVSAPVYAVQLDKGAGSTLSDWSGIEEASAGATYGPSGRVLLALWVRSSDGGTYTVHLRDTSGVLTNFVVTSAWQKISVITPVAAPRIQLLLRGTYGTSDSANLLVCAPIRVSLPAALSDVEYHDPLGNHGWGVDGVRWYSTGPNGEDLTSASSGFPVRCTGVKRRPAITNKVTYSQDFSNALWSKTALGTGVTPVVSGSTITFNIGGNLIGDSSLVAVAAAGMASAEGVVDTFTVWMRASRAQDIGKIIVARSVDGGTGYLPLTLSADWQKLVYTVAVPAVATSPQFGLRGTTGSSTGEVQVEAFCQYEVGSVSNDYVPTTTAAVTANAEAWTLDDEVIGYDQRGGVWEIEFTPDYPASYQANNQTVLYAYSAAGTDIFVYNGSGFTRLLVRDGGVHQALLDRAAWTQGQASVVRAQILTNAIEFSVTGDAPASDTSAVVPAVTTIEIGRSFFSGSIKSIKYYAPPPEPPPPAPVISVNPAVSGTLTVGSTLTGTSGTWTNSPTGYTYQWQRSANGTSGWSDIAGATASTRVLQAADEAQYLRVGVVASNAGGAGTVAYSAATGQIQAAPPAATFQVRQTKTFTTNGAGASGYTVQFDQPLKAGSVIVFLAAVHEADTAVAGITGITASGVTFSTPEGTLTDGNYGGNAWAATSSPLAADVDPTFTLAIASAETGLDIQGVAVEVEKGAVRDADGYRIGTASGGTTTAIPATGTLSASSGIRFAAAGTAFGLPAAPAGWTALRLHQNGVDGLLGFAAAYKVLSANSDGATSFSHADGVSSSNGKSISFVIPEAV